MLRNLIFPNGICMAHDGVSFLFAETWGCRVSRYWFDGPKAGTVEPVIPNLPGYPDNINRASDGSYWLALVGMRTPSLDLALKMPGFRRRMARRVAPDEWLFPNINTGCVLRFDDEGQHSGGDVGSRRREPPDDHLDARAQGASLHRRHAQQPHRQAAAPGRRSQLDRPSVLLGRRMTFAFTRILDAALGRGESAITIPALDGALRPNRRLDEASHRIPISRPSGIIAGARGRAGQRRR